MAIPRVWAHGTDFGGTAPPQLTTAPTGGAPPYSGGGPTNRGAASGDGWRLRP